MKVLYITNYGSMYGANLSLFYLTTYLKQTYGIEPYILVPGGGVIQERLQPYGIECVCCDFRLCMVKDSVTPKWFRKTTRRIMRYADYFRILRIIKKKGLSFDLIHTNTSITDIGYFLAKQMGIPHIWHVREFAREHYGLEYVFSGRALRRMLSRSASVIAISDAIYDKMRSAMDEKGLTKIYNGIPVCTRYEKSYHASGEVYFCTVGSISHNKNQMDIIKACEKIMAEGNDAFRLFIVGGNDTEYAGSLQDYLDKRPALQKKIVFTGYQEKVDELLKGMDVGVLASEAEAFGRVTVEYMANYMPVIGADSGGTSELIQNVGILYSLHDIDALAKAMNAFIEDRSQIEALGKKSRARSESFTLEKNAEEIYQLYKEILNNL